MGGAGHREYKLEWEWEWQRARGGRVVESEGQRIERNGGGGGEVVGH